MQKQTTRERVRYLAWRVLSALPEHNLTVRTEQGKFAFSNKDREIGRQLFLNRSFDFDKVTAVQRLLADLGYLENGNGRYLVDVGANVGTVCVSLLRNGVFSRALAFEPAPKNYSLLVKNIRKNGLSGAILPFNCALSSAEAVLEMELSGDNYGDHRVRTQDPSMFSNEQFTESSRQLVKVRACRLDDVLATVGVKPQDIGLLWLDVQGHEKYALEGAQSAIEAGVPVVAEFWPYGLVRAGVSFYSFSDFISSRFTSFYDLNLDPIVGRPAADIANLFGRYQGISFTDLLLVTH